MQAIRAVGETDEMFRECMTDKIESDSDMSTKVMAPHMSLHCNLCGKNVFKNPEDYFMLKDEVWDEVCDNGYVRRTHILCKSCTEYWLGRKLTPSDYKDAPVNDFLKRGSDENN